MRWMGILVAMMVVMSVPAYAQVTATGSAGVGVRSNAKVGAPMPRPHVPADFNNMPPEQKVRYKERILEELRQRLGDRKLQELRKRGIDPEAIAARVLEKREAAAKGNGLVVAPAQMKKWRDITEKYRNAVMRIQNATLRYVQKEREWAQYKAKFQRGEIDENTYFQKTKEMILSAIDATMERLESVKDNADNPGAVDTAISKLQEIRAEVEAAKNLDELRAIYKEDVLPTLRKHNRKVFAKYYIVGTLHATASIVNRLDVATAQLTRYVEFTKEKGIYDEEMETRVNTIFTDIEAVKAELNALEAEVKAKDIQDPHEYMQKVKEIKDNVGRIYREIKDLIVDYNKRIAVQVRNRVREYHVVTKQKGTEEEVNASGSEEEAAETQVEAGTTEESGVNSSTATGQETNTAESEENTETNTSVTVSANVTADNNILGGEVNGSVAVTGNMEVIP